LPNLISPMHSTEISGGAATHHTTPHHTHTHTPHTTHHTPHTLSLRICRTPCHHTNTRRAHPPDPPARPLEHAMRCNMVRIREPGPEHGTRFTHPDDHAYLACPILHSTARHTHRRFATCSASTSGTVQTQIHGRAQLSEACRRPGQAAAGRKGGARGSGSAEPREREEEKTGRRGLFWRAAAVRAGPRLGFCGCVGVAPSRRMGK
jgi:hypothetical protein